MKIIFYRILQFVWGMPQNIAGLIACLINRDIRNKDYKGQVLSVWKKREGISLGIFVFLPEDFDEQKDADLLKHECGHSLQSLILGPLYLLVIGLPSLIWSQSHYMCDYRERRGISYYNFIVEKWADKLGKVKRKS